MDWKTIINQEQQKEYYKELQSFIDTQYETTKIYPKKENIFKAFELCPYENLKVVILGQDPYHQKDQAQGLAFSTPNHIKNPPSMVNIIKEIINDIGDCQCLDGDLTPWAKQGILLINAILTVEDSKPKSHEKKVGRFLQIILSNISLKIKKILSLSYGVHLQLKNQN